MIPWARARAREDGAWTMDDSTTKAPHRRDWFPRKRNRTTLSNHSNVWALYMGDWLLAYNFQLISSSASSSAGCSEFGSIGRRVAPCESKAGETAGYMLILEIHPFSIVQGVAYTLHRVDVWDDAFWLGII
jgi:hypothetical protein